VQYLRDLGRFEMNKDNLGRQRDRIFDAEEEILPEIENQANPRASLPAVIFT
jgi:hypothetical protein